VAALAPLRSLDGSVTLLYAARDREHNNAAALAKWLAAEALPATGSRL
jgi:uncharacterized protein YeaO (DUF488 family)